MVSYLSIPALVSSLIVLALASIGLNSLCVYIITSTKALRKKTSNLLLINLLAVHFFQGLFVFPLYAGKKFKNLDFKVAQFFANGFRFTYMLTFYGTCLGILFISVDRFLATYLLTKYKTIVTRKRVKIALVLLWIYIFALCLLPFIDVSPPKMKTKFNKATNLTETYEVKKFYIYQQQREWVLFMLIVNTAIPYVLIILCYIYIIQRLRRMGAYKLKPSDGRQARAHSAIELLDKNGEKIQLKKRDVEKHKQVTKLTLILTVLYGLFWTPSIIYYPLKEDCKSCFPSNYEDSKLEQYIGYITKYLAFLDAVAAPLLYCFMHSEFQRSLERIRSKLLRQPLPERNDVTTTLGETTELM